MKCDVKIGSFIPAPIGVSINLGWTSATHVGLYILLYYYDPKISGLFKLFQVHSLC